MKIGIHFFHVYCFTVDWYFYLFIIEKLGCASIDKAAIKKKVFDAMINSVEAMYKDTSVFRKKKSTQTKGETAAISDVFILPLEIQRFHEKGLIILLMA